MDLLRKIDMYDAIGIEAGVMLPYINVECAYDTVTNREIAEMAAAHSGRLHWFCNIDPRQGGNAPDTDFSNFLTYYRALGACGVGEICGSLPLDDPRMLNLLKHCERCGLPVIFHFGGASGDYGVVDEFGLPRLEYVFDRFPALKVLGHSQRFWSLISGDAPVDVWNGYPKGRVAAGGRVVELMRRYGNLCGDLSAGSGYNALSRDPEFACDFIEEFQDRLFYGTDFTRLSAVHGPAEKLAAFLDEAVLTGRISRAAYEKVCRGNALRLIQAARRFAAS